MLSAGLPRLYAILDGSTIRAADLDLLDAARALCEAGVRLLQYRDKKAEKDKVLRNARAIREIFPQSETLLILNDWPDLAVEAGWDGVHIGQTDVSVAEARARVGTTRVIGVSTHTVEQFRGAVDTDADYIAYGPIFGTRSKANAEPAVGLARLREVRTLSERPLVAIGGISGDRMPSVFAAGADSIALISALFTRGEPVRDAALRLVGIADSAKERAL